MCEEICCNYLMNDLFCCKLYEIGIDIVLMVGDDYCILFNGNW